MKTIICILYIVCAAVCFADDKDVRIIPLLNYEFVSLANQQYHVPGGGLIALNIKKDPSSPERNSSLFIGLFYEPRMVREILPGYAELYHDIDLVIEKKTGPHLLHGYFTANSDRPVYGGLHTLFARAGYGYELIRKENLSLTLGMTLGVGDFGIDLPNGAAWPLLPTPIVRLAFNSPIINLALDFPEIELVLFPENRVRMTGAVDLDIYNINDIHDLRFNSILWYRFFDKDSKMGDFLGMGLGIQNAGQNHGADFSLGEKGRTYDINYYAVFGTVDAGFLQLSGGYIFYGREIYDGDYRRATGRGFFVRAEVRYQFTLK